MLKLKKKNHQADDHDGQASNAAKPAKTSKPGNALLRPWMVLLFFLLTGIIALMAWIEMGFSIQTNENIKANYKKSVIGNITQISDVKFASTQKELDKISNSQAIRDAVLQQDQAHIDALGSMIASGFNNSVSFQIIPWDMSGTAGLKTRNIELRNNAELMLVSQAGNMKTPNAEAYKHDNNWFISFSSPVIHNDTVIAILLLSFNKHFLADILKSPAFSEKARMDFYLKNQPGEIITSIGSGNAAISEKAPAAFTDGEMSITFNEEILTPLQQSFQSIYIAIASLHLMLLIICIIGYRTSLGFVKKDAESIMRYAESLSGLHKTRQPELFISSLSPLLELIDGLGQRTVKTTISTEIAEDYKSPQATVLPDKIAMPTVADKNSFEHRQIFRDYDIRGIADTQLNTDACIMIGKAIGSEALASGMTTLVVGRDGRVSSERILYDLSRGITSTGCNVINLGLAPTPAVYFATEKLATGGGVVVTGSHNPAEYNGMKIVLNHKTLQGDELQNLLTRIEAYDFAEGEGKISKHDISTDYIQEVGADIIVAKPLSVVVDAGNGVGGAISNQLLTMLDCNVTMLHAEVDGTFPNHGPDPSVRANLTDLVNKVREINADLGIAFDGDADRMVAVTSSGEVVDGDKLLMLFAKDIVSRNAASNIVYDIKCSANVEKVISQYGGRAIMTKSGHSNIKAMMQETGALLGGELTGHFCFKERWNGFDDGIYAALRLIELLSTSSNTLDEEIAALPSSHTTPELVIAVDDHLQAKQIVSKLHDSLSLESCKIDTTDGVRADFGHGWGLIRASNTSSSLSLRFEADSSEELARIQTLFKNLLGNLNQNLYIPF